MMYFSHTRQQWPVGHGFFHTASINVGDNHYRYIYDCGSQGQHQTSSELIKKQITKYAEALELEQYDESLKLGQPAVKSGKPVIDMLVLSHFHADHINGVPELFKNFTINKLVIPHLEEEFKLTMLIQLLVEGRNSWNLLSDFIINPKKWVESREYKTQIIEIFVNGGDQQQEDVDTHDDGLSLGRKSEKVNHQSLESIYKNNQTIWWFKFYLQENPQDAKRILKKLIAELGLKSKEDLMSILKGKDDHRWNEIRDIYVNEFKKDQNVISLCMYSSPATALNHQRAYRYQNISNYESICCGRIPDMRAKCGWLGTGDAKLKGDPSYSKFELHFDKLLRNLDTITIPHHGSIENYDPRFGHLGYHHVITAPTNDPKGNHPAAPVLVNLLSYSRNVQVVTAESRTAFFQHIKGRIGA